MLIIKRFRSSKVGGRGVFPFSFSFWGIYTDIKKFLSNRTSNAPAPQKIIFFISLLCHYFTYSLPAFPFLLIDCVD